MIPSAVLFSMVASVESAVESERASVVLASVGVVVTSLNIGEPFVSVVIPGSVGLVVASAGG